MKKFFLIAVALIMGANSHTMYGQNFSKAEDFAKLKKFNEAYTELQKLKQNDKKGRLENNVEYYYWLGHISAQAAINDQKIEGVDGTKLEQLKQGFALLKKAYEIKKDFPNFIITQSSPYADFWSIYVYASQKGIDAFNEKKYAEAIEPYETAAEVSTFLATHDMGMPAIDSSLTHLRALTYINLKDVEKASPLIEKVVQIKYNPSQALEMVKWVLFQAMESKNQALFDRFKALGASYFPEKKADLWDLIEDEHKLNSAKDEYEKLLVYQSLINAGTSVRVKYNYIVDAYQYLLDNKSKLEEAKYVALLSSMQPIAEAIYATEDKNLVVLYLYEVSLFNYVERLNTKVAQLRKTQREKAAPVQGKPAKGSKLEKELNDIKNQINGVSANIKKWAASGFPLTDNLISMLEKKASDPAAEKSIRSQLENALDIGSGLAYYAGLDEKSTLYEQKRKSISQK